MRSAPSVTYPVGRSVLWLGLLMVAGFLGMVALVLGAFYDLGFWGLLGSIAWLIWGVAGIQAWRRQPQGRLAWVPFRGHGLETSLPPSAGHWSWSSAAYLEGVVLRRVERVHDLQAWMLLRLHNPDGARTWVWVERRSDPDRWDDLRRALWAHA